MCWAFSYKLLGYSEAVFNTQAHIKTFEDIFARKLWIAVDDEMDSVPPGRRVTAQILVFLHADAGVSTL